ncbi:MAG: hypothetical protein KatS3mg075_500 [Meiothermus sp.]|nr:MAG: hypothetical protein KatS3mg075_500 [Meiothermus sp.]
MTLKTSKRGKHYFPEARIVRGPRVMGETADNSFEALLGYAWMGMLDRTQGLRLFQARKTAPSSQPWPIGSTEEAEWVEVAIPPIPHPVKEVRHLALCFDQAARHVVAYERQGEVWIRQWDPLAGTFTMRGPFPGVDPVLLWDFEVGYYLPDSDVLLVHLSPDRTQVIMRVQRELYATPLIIQTLPSPAYLDQAVALPYQGQILGSSEDNPNVTGLVLRTDWYPYRVPMNLRVLGRFDDGLYRQISFEYFQNMAFGLSGRFAQGDYALEVLQYQAQARIAIVGQFATGEYRQVLTIYDPADMKLGLSGRFSAGSYALIATKYDHADMKLALSGRFVGGTYA